MIEKRIDFELKIKMSLLVSFQSYFCGQGSECVQFNNANALKRAKTNVEQLYPVVAVLEQLEDSLNLMEEKLPVFFKNLRRFRKSETCLRIVQFFTQRAPVFFSLCRESLPAQ